MKTLLTDVAAFHRAGDIPAFPSIAARTAAAGPPTAEEMRLRLKLIIEEVEEIFEAHGVSFEGNAIHTAFKIINGAIEQIVTPTCNDIDAIADGLVDSIYVHVGAALQYGLPLDHVWDAVQKANMAKFPGGRAIRREDGKVIKPEGWQPPNILEALEKESEAEWVKGE